MVLFSRIIREMLKNMDQVIRNITDQRRSHSVTVMGQLKAGLKLVHYFDEETLEFISKYYRKGVKKGCQPWTKPRSCDKTRCRVYVSGISVVSQFFRSGKCLMAKICSFEPLLWA